MTKIEQPSLSNKVFVGKTIKSVKVLGVNCWAFCFTDKTFAVIDTVSFGAGFFGPELIAYGSKDEVNEKIGSQAL